MVVGTENNEVETNLLQSKYFLAQDKLGWWWTDVETLKFYKIITIYIANLVII